MLRFIAELAARNDLAAVILHLNDTYQIEERPPDIPGMARIAEAVRLIARWVRSSAAHAASFLHRRMIAVSGVSSATTARRPSEISPVAPSSAIQSPSRICRPSSVATP